MRERDRDEVSPEEDLVNAFRLAKGDLMVAKNGKGKISHAIPARLTIMKELVRKEIFPYHYEIYGMGFLELQSAFRTPWAAKCSSVLLEQWGIGPSAGTAAAMYLNVCRLLGNARVAQVEMALNMTERRRTKGEVWRGKERRKEESLLNLSAHFVRLIEIMDAEKERIEELRKNV